MGLTLGATGKLMTLNGKLFTDENGMDCCCGVSCGCDDLPTTLSGRIVFSGVGCPDPAVCVITGTSYVTLTDTTPIPEDLEVPCGEVGRYYTGTIDDPCSVAQTLIEVACCGATDPAEFYIRQGGTGSWSKMSPPELEGYDYSPGDCQCAWGWPLGGFGAGFTCCGTSAFYVWWGDCDEPPVECGDTGPTSV